jgi:hypothetical protein
VVFDENPLREPKNSSLGPCHYKPLILDGFDGDCNERTV